TAIKTVQILGIPFYNDSLETALQIAHHDGGLFLAPSGPGLAELGNNPYYDRALQKADINLIDSGYLALLWKKRTGESVQRHSGLKFIQALIETSSFKKNTRQLWVMPDQAHSDATKHYLSKQQIKLDDEHFYLAPHYTEPPIEDQALLDMIRAQRPDFVILTIAGGKQEVLGYWLRNQLDYEPTILCIGAAIAFLTGKQVSIPKWADRIYIGWLLRIITDPKTFLPRYWSARKLRSLLKRWGTQMPQSSQH
ncbi:MAG TPA: glycosyltransferase, partial [Opitutae bacterium]|nr:glycosyltransferase [Opitutae bacterium]